MQTTPDDVMRKMLERLAEHFAEEPLPGDDREADLDAETAAAIIVHEAMKELGSVVAQDENGDMSPFSKGSVDSSQK